MLRRTLHSPITAWGALALICAAAATIVLAKIWYLTFHFDEWNFFLNRRGSDLDTYLEPHNEHLSLIPVAVFKALLSTVGAEDYWPFALLIVVANLACGVLVYRFARDRVGIVPALCGAAVLMLFGPAWNDLLMPFQIGFLGSLATGIGMINSLERGRDALASFLLACSLSFSSIGIVFAIGALVYTLLSRDGVAARLVRAARVLAAPAVLYTAWYIAYGKSSLELENSFVALRYAGSLVSNTSAAGFGLEPGWGPPIVLALAAGTAYTLTQPTRVPVLTWTLAAMAAAHPLFTAMGRAGTSPPDSSRYLYPTLVFLLLLAFELLRGRTLRARGGFLLALLTVGIVLANQNSLRHEPIIKSYASFIGPKLAMVELARDQVPPDFRVDEVRAPDIFAGTYLAAVDEYGSPADSIEEVQRRKPDQRTEADRTLLGAINFRIEYPAPAPRPAGPPPAPVAVTGTVGTRGSCIELTPAGGVGALELKATAPRVLVGASGEGPVTVRIRRFGDTFTDPPAGVIEGLATAIVGLPSDRAAVPWMVLLTAETPFQVCRLA